MARLTLLTMTSSGHGQDDGRKIQDAGNAGIHERVGHFLRGGGRHGEDGHLDAVFLDEARAVCPCRRMACLISLSRLRRGSASKPAMISKPSFSNPRYESESQAEMADADEDDRLQSRGAEFIGDPGGQLSHVVAQAAGAERCRNKPGPCEVAWI